MVGTEPFEGKRHLMFAAKLLPQVLIALLLTVLDNSGDVLPRLQNDGRNHKTDKVFEVIRT